MPRLLCLSVLALASLSGAVGSALPRSAPFEHLKQRRQSTNDNLVVDLGYETYEGHLHQTSGLNEWLGYETLAA